MKDLPAIQDLGLGLFRDPTSSSDKHSDHSWAHDERGMKYYTGCINDSDKLCLVAETDDKVVGYLTAEPNNTEYDWRPIKVSELDSFYVAPEYRSQGAGAQMVKEFVKWSKSWGADTAYVSAYADNDRGISFYKKVGFKPQSLGLEMELE